jgi:hypothetical protein
LGLRAAREKRRRVYVKANEEEQQKMREVTEVRIGDADVGRADLYVRCACRNGQDRGRTRLQEKHC